MSRIVDIDDGGMYLVRKHESFEHYISVQCVPTLHTLKKTIVDGIVSENEREKCA